MWLPLCHAERHFSFELLAMRLPLCHAARHFIFELLAMRLPLCHAARHPLLFVIFFNNKKKAENEPNAHK